MQYPAPVSNDDIGNRLGASPRAPRFAATVHQRRVRRGGIAHHCAPARKGVAGPVASATPGPRFDWRRTMSARTPHGTTALALHTWAVLMMSALAPLGGSGNQRAAMAVTLASESLRMSGYTPESEA